MTEQPDAPLVVRLSDSVTIIRGDCLAVLPTLSDVDAIVTDPPYGLSFMGKDWDHGVPGAHFWIEALRVAKPGAYLLAFGGTRTFHRLACAIEDAGWEIRDCVMWVYGCLSEDTEVLTINGWEHYHKDIDRYPVLCYRIDNDSFEFQKPKRGYVYENKHTAYRIQSDNTDQIVSRNHRVLVERGGRKVFIYAEALQRQEDVPFLESLQDLPESIPNIYEGTSVTKQDLLERLCKSSCWKEEQREKADKNSVPNVQETVLSKRAEQKKTEKILFVSLCRKSKRLVEKLFCQWEGNKKSQEVALWRKQSCVEGRSNLFQNARKLCWSKICALSERVFAYGEERRVYNGASFDNGEVVKEVLAENRGGASCQSRSDRQQYRESTAIQNQSGTQVIRRTQATVTPIEYKGKVWCVEVESGAFVARRNGKIFITGNSGFPKSHNVGLRIDKMNGAPNRGHRIAVANRYHPDGTLESNGELLPAYEAKTEQGKLWQGWGTALKPAYEPIILARKPLAGTVAANVLEHGVGGINIDACRIGTGDDKTSGGCAGTNRLHDGGISARSGVDYTIGRWPANILHDGSPEVLSLFPDTKAGVAIRHKSGGNTFGGENPKPPMDDLGYGDSGSAARFFYCAKASRKDRDEGLDAIAPTSAGDITGGRTEGSPGLNSPRAGAGRTSGGRNFHPTVKPTDLMRYLCRLVTPPGGTILDPFMGSGSTGKAALREGFRFIGIERDADSFAVARARLENELRQELLPLSFKEPVK